MKKVIGGKIYDTNTATLIDSDWCRIGIEFNQEELYRKRTGEYFLRGEGGASTRWRKGSGIFPLTDAKALEWAEEYMDADDIIELFEITEE